jgi:uncharacterized protein YoxC
MGKIIIELEKKEMEDAVKIFDELRQDMNDVENKLNEILDEVKSLLESIKTFEKEVSNIGKNR